MVLLLNLILLGPAELAQMPSLGSLIEATLVAQVASVLSAQDFLNDPRAAECAALWL